MIPKIDEKVRDALLEIADYIELYPEKYTQYQWGEQQEYGAHEQKELICGRCIAGTHMHLLVRNKIVPSAKARTPYRQFAKLVGDDNCYITDGDWPIPIAELMGWKYEELDITMMEEDVPYEFPLFKPTAQQAVAVLRAICDPDHALSLWTPEDFE